MYVLRMLLKRVFSLKQAQVIISLYFGTMQGEGGSFALYQGVYPPEERDVDSDRVLTGDSVTLQTSVGSRGKLIKKLRWPLFVWVRSGVV